MRSWDAALIARAAGAELLRAGAASGGPERVTIDSREAGPGALFVGLPGQRVDGGEFAGQALAEGVWGVLAASAHAERAAEHGPPETAGAILAAPDPLAALQGLATAWRRELGAATVGVTGSTGKTSTKDILQALLSPHRATFVSRANFNTEIGLPLELLAAPAGTEALVLEMGMRGPGQIAELARIAEPDVAVIVSIGPVHLELLGSLEAIAAAKAELIAGLPAGGTAVIPHREPLLERHRRADVRTLTFGEEGDVRFLGEATGERLTIAVPDGDPVELEFPLPQAHLRVNLLAAVAAASALGVRPAGRVEVALSPGRGQRVELPGAAVLIDDCYNANPMSMRAALDDLALTAASRGGARRVAVLGDMLELGPRAAEYHREIGRHAAGAGVDVLVAVGPLAESIAEAFSGGRALTAPDAQTAAGLVAGILEPGDAVLVKASRGVGLEAVCNRLSSAG